MESSVSNKGYMGKSESFAAGGPVLGRTTDFLKTPDRFTGLPAAKNIPTSDDFSKGKSKANPKAESKSETPIKPRK